MRYIFPLIAPKEINTCRFNTCRFCSYTQCLEVRLPFTTAWMAERHQSPLVPLPHPDPTQTSSGRKLHEFPTSINSQDEHCPGILFPSHLSSPHNCTQGLRGSRSHGKGEGENTAIGRLGTGCYLKTPVSFLFTDAHHQLEIGKKNHVNSALPQNGEKRGIFVQFWFFHNNFGLEYSCCSG